jgi:transposase
VLRQSLARYDDIARYLTKCDSKLQAELTNLAQKKIDLGKPPRTGSKQRKEYDTRQILANWSGVDLTRINGLGVAAVTKILTEIGPDLSRFPTVKHFCSWLGLSPGTKISGGKALSSKTKRLVNRVRQVLKMAAMSLSRCDCALGAFYRRLCARMGKPSANTAVAHKLARMVYFVLTRGEEFVDKAQQHYEEQQLARSVAALKRRATTLGFVVTPVAAQA